ncbi:MAG: primosomal protein N', partial [Gemmatimonadota bacterium]
LAARGLLEITHQSPALKPPLRRRQMIALTRDLQSLRERDQLFAQAPRQRQLYEYLESVDRRAAVSHLTEQLGISRSVVRGLIDKGVAELHEEEVSPDPFAHIAPPEDIRHEPSAAQAAAIRSLLAAAGQQTPGVFVLKGVTGSGKTLVYIELLRELVGRRDRGAILLVPEISLTPQTVSRFRAAFADDVALLHSALSEGERFAAWQALRAGRKRIVIGARSAIFAPVRDLGCIIIDEEHESSYKQSDPAPRYHAREVALMRARHTGAMCLLGSATPSLESWSRLRAQDWTLLELPERIGARPLPAVQLIDLRRKAKSAGSPVPARAAAPAVLSEPLRQQLVLRLERGEQAILFLNRRGYANFAQCRDCGSVLNCWQCNVSLTRHRRPPRLVCHYCNHQQAVPELCPDCGSPNLSQLGVGTEQVERVLEETFPRARLARMDVDTTSVKWAHHEILARVERREVDILLGTQMIAKGLDFPNVTLVGVINADVGLNLPDFRASERTFQLLTQVAGRAGRGPAGGEVIIQTSLPDHYAVRFALDHDYGGFAERELDERAAPGYPPHTRLANIVFSGRDQLRVQETAEGALDWLAGLFQARGVDDIEVLGPAPCPIDRIRNRWRWHIVLKSRAGSTLGQVLRYFASRFRAPAPGLRVEIDRDPVSLL